MTISNYLKNIRKKVLRSKINLFFWKIYAPAIRFFGWFLSDPAQRRPHPHPLLHLRPRGRTSYRLHQQGRGSLSKLGDRSTMQCRKKAKKTHAITAKFQGLSTQKRIFQQGFLP